MDNGTATIQLRGSATWRAVDNHHWTANILLRGSPRGCGSYEPPRGLTLRELATKSGYSRSTLSNAESGQRVPSWLVVEAFTQAYGADVTEWRLAWQQANRDDPAPPEPAPPEAVAQPAPRRRAHTVTALAGAGVLLFAAGWFAGWFLHPAPGATAAAPARPSVDGQDPYINGCGPDEKELEHKTIRWPGGSEYGELVLFHSAKCEANWGYVYGPNSPAWSVHITARRLEDGRSAPATAIGQVGKPNSWGNLMSTANGCVQVEAYVQRGANRGPTATSSCYSSGGPVQSNASH